MAAQCKAKAKSTGKRCTRPSIDGGAVCRYHGGAAPQVQAKARERLAALVDPAIDTLGVMVRKRSNPKVALAAARDVLDRNDLGAKQKHEHSGPGGGPIETVDLAALEVFSVEELERIQARFRAKREKAP